MAAIFALLLLAGILIPAGLAEEAVQEVLNPDQTSNDANQKILELTEETRMKFADINQAMHGLIARMERLEQMMSQHLDHHSSTHDSGSHRHDSQPRQYDSHHFHHQEEWDHSSHQHDHSSHHDDHTPHDHSSHNDDHTPHDHSSHNDDHTPHDHSSHNDDHTSHQDDHTTHQEDQQEDLTPHQHIHHHSSDVHSAETISHEDNHPHGNEPTFHFYHSKTNTINHDSSDHHSDENDHDSPASSTPAPAVEPPFTKTRTWQTGLGDGQRSRPQERNDPNIDGRNFIHGAEGNTLVWVNATQSFNATTKGRGGTRIFHHRQTHRHGTSHGRRPSNPPVRHATYFKHGNHFHLIANVNFDSDDYLWGTCDMRPNRALPPELQQNVTGRINLWQHKTDGFLHLHLNLTGFARGGSHLHGFHVHDVPNMTQGCEMVGEHFNPHGQNHGSPESTERHVGDLGNIKCDPSGHLNGYLLDNMASLRLGMNNIVGLPLVIHANPDDLGVNKDNMYSTSYGNAGPKIACCIVTAVSRLSDDYDD